MMEAAEEVSREEIQKVKTEIGDDLEKEKLQVKNAEKVIKSGSLQNLTNLEQSSEPSNRKLQSHEESMVRLDAANEKKIEAEDREMSVKINQVVVVDLVPSPLPKPDANLQAKTLPSYLEDEKNNVELNHHFHGIQQPPSKSPDTELKVVASEIQIIQAVGVEIQPPPKPPDVSRSASTLLRRIPLPELLDTSLGVVDRQLLEMMTARIIMTATKSISGERLHSTTIMGENVLEKIGTKVVIGELGILLKPMGQMHKSLPYILHCNLLLHVSSSGQHTFSLLSPLSYVTQWTPFTI
jgi:hypothetical protein